MFCKNDVQNEYSAVLKEGRPAYALGTTIPFSRVEVNSIKITGDIIKNPDITFMVIDDVQGKSSFNTGEAAYSITEINSELKKLTNHSDCLFILCKDIKHHKGAEIKIGLKFS